MKNTISQQTNPISGTKSKVANSLKPVRFTFLGIGVKSELPQALHTAPTK